MTDLTAGQIAELVKAYGGEHSPSLGENRCRFHSCGPEYPCRPALAQALSHVIRREAVTERMLQNAATALCFRKVEGAIGDAEDSLVRGYIGPNGAAINQFCENHEADRVIAAARKRIAEEQK